MTEKKCGKKVLGIVCSWNIFTPLFLFARVRWDINGSKKKIYKFIDLENYGLVIMKHLYMCRHKTIQNQDKKLKNIFSMFHNYLNILKFWCMELSSSRAVQALWHCNLSLACNLLSIYPEKIDLKGRPHSTNLFGDQISLFYKTIYFSYNKSFAIYCHLVSSWVPD
jgi:hypothetical protein